MVVLNRFCSRAQPPFDPLVGVSLEMTGRDVDALREAAGTLPAGARVNITYLAHEGSELRVAAARAARELGFTPVAHLAARRIESRDALSLFLEALCAVGAAEEVFVVAGDPSRAAGPYDDGLALIDSGLLERHDVQRVSIAGYPDGHPTIDSTVLWRALADKAALLEQRGLAGDIVTQFGFDADAVLGWIEQVRNRGIELPVRVGVPGPAGAKRLLAYARRFGVASGATVARKYGLSLGNLVATAGPNRFIDDLVRDYDPARHGAVALHFYTFGGIAATAAFLRDLTRAG